MPTFLHVGCGPLRKDQTTPGFAGDAWAEVRLDIEPAVEPDIIGSMTDMAAVPDAFVDAVYSAHNIEHVYFFEVPAVLAEFRRVLRPDGFLVVTCPDLQAVAALVAEGILTGTAYESTGGPVSPMDMLFGHGASLAEGRMYMAHKCGFTRELLAHVLAEAGFANVAVKRRPGFFELWAVASKSERSQAELLAIASQYFPA